jgi:hypothetical protein
MENLPFLKNNDVRSPPGPIIDESPNELTRRFEPLFQSQEIHNVKPNLAELFHDSRITFILLGIIIGVIIMNMRPVVLHTKG